MKNKEHIAFLIDNKDIHIAQKKAETKKADGFTYFTVNNQLKTLKTDISQIDLTNTNALSVKAIINTTNVMDSHDDVHIPGLWTKTLNESKNILHLQEHQNSFENIIASGNDLNAYTKYYDWKDLGYDYEGQTQALEFDSNVKKNRNKYMFEQYANGYVVNHSVGMKYVKIFLAVNEENYPDEYQTWNRYIDSIVNRELAEEKGYFYAVTEAKLIEGSAVPIGSNHITPTRSVTPKEIETELKEQKEILIQILNKINKSENEPVPSTLQKDTCDIEFLKDLKIKLK